MKVAAKSAEPLANPESLKGLTGGYANNFSQNQADECREAYLQYYKIAQAVSLAHKMGVMEMTLRTPTGVVSIPVISEKWMTSIYVDLQEMLGDKMEEMEKDIIEYEEEAKREERDCEGLSDRARLFSHCLPMRRFSDAEYNALPAEAQRAHDMYGQLERIPDHLYGQGQPTTEQQKGGAAL